MSISACMNIYCMNTYAADLLMRHWEQDQNLNIVGKRASIWILFRSFSWSFLDPLGLFGPQSYVTTRFMLCFSAWQCAFMCIFLHTCHADRRVGWGWGWEGGGVRVGGWGRA